MLLITLTENRGPTKDEDFVTTVNESLFHWSQTSSGRSGGKWWDAVLDEVLRELAVSPEYKKGNGELNFLKLATSLGVEPENNKESTRSNGFFVIVKLTPTRLCFEKYCTDGECYNYWKTFN